MPSDTVSRHAPGLAPQQWIATLVAVGIVISGIRPPRGIWPTRSFSDATRSSRNGSAAPIPWTGLGRSGPGQAVAGSSPSTMPPYESVVPARRRLTRVRWAGLDNLAGTEQEVAGEAALTGTRTDVPAAWGPADDVGDRYMVARIVTEHSGYPQWSQPVQVSLRLRGERVQVVGIARPR